MYILPKIVDEQVARFHLTQLDASLTELTGEQAAYLSVDGRGPYKYENYCY